MARHLLETGRFRVRGLTRNPGSKSAKELGAHASGNLEVVRADLEDVDSLRGAFRGCYGVYAVTNCWEHGWDAETRHGKNMVDAARAEGCVRHFVWSTMEHSGELECWHFDSKARVNDYLLQSGLPRTSIYTAAYYENFEKQLRPSKQTDSITGKTFYQIDFNVIPPDVKFFAFCGTEIGAWISQVFLDPDKYIDHDVRLVVEWLTTREMAATASSVTGLDVRPRECTEEELVKTQGKGEILVDLYRMTKYYITVPLLVATVYCGCVSELTCV